MSNSKNSNLEDVSKGNDESAPGANDSTSKKKTRFTKSKSISEVFKELESEEGLSADLDSNLETLESDIDETISAESNVENIESITEEAVYEDLEAVPEDAEYLPDENIGDVEYVSDFENADFEDSSVDEIIPIHNEYRDLEKSDALDEDSTDGILINPDLDDSIKANVTESNETIDSIENTESIIGEAKDSESIDSVKDIDDEDSFIDEESDDVLADGLKEVKVKKSSAQGVLINNKYKSSDSNNSFEINSSIIFTVIGFIVGLGILILGITYYTTSSDRVVDNVLSGETAGLAVFLVIIGLIIIAFSVLKFLSSSKSSLIIDTFNNIKSIDYDDVNEDAISRDDFENVFSSIFKRKKDSSFSNNGEDDSVDSPKDLFESSEEKLSDEDINSLYSESNLTPQRNHSSSKKHADANSTEISQDSQDEIDEIIPIHSELNNDSSDDFADNLKDDSEYIVEDDFADDSDD